MTAAVGPVLRANLRAAARAVLDWPAGSAETVLAEIATGTWGELDYQLRRGQGACGWSVGAEAAVHRLVAIMQVVGPTPIERVPFPVIASGLYDAVLAAAGMRCPDPPSTVRRVREHAGAYPTGQ